MNNAEGFYIGPPQSPATPEGGAKEAQPNQSPSKLVGSGSSGSALLPIGSKCSIYQTYTLRVEYMKDGNWHAHTNYDEHEADDAFETAHDIRSKRKWGSDDARVIRIRFEVLQNRSGSATGEARCAVAGW